MSNQDSSEQEQLLDAGPVIARSLARQLNDDQLEAIISVQRDSLSRFEKTNEMLTNCNTLSVARLNAAVKELQPYRQMLMEMKRDLDAIFRRIRTYKQNFSQMYPEEFDAVSAQQNATGSPQTEDTEDESAVNNDTAHSSIILADLSGKITSIPRINFPMTSSEDVIEVDGSVLEGGGQILRMTMVFSALLRKNVRIVKIRAGRDKPGLRPQHLMGLNMVGDLCGGKLVGAEVGSTTVTFYPGKLQGGEFLADTKTAGSVSLLMQVAIPPALFARGDTKLTLRGGTNADMAPQIDYTTQIFKPMAEKFGVGFDCDIIRRGYYPKGGGAVVVTTNPVKSLQAVNIIERGDLVKITGRSWVAGVLPIKVAYETSRSASAILRPRFPNINIDVESVKEPDHAAVGNGAGIILVGHTSTGCLIGSDALGKRGVPSEQVGANASNAFIKNWDSGGCVDERMQDQLIVLMALSTGLSRVKTGPLTLHTQTAIHIAQQLTDAKFTIKDADEGQSKFIECQGIALENTNE